MSMRYDNVGKTTSVTFRMPDKLYGVLQKQARENRTSLNTLVNQILYTHFFDNLPIVRPMLVVVPTPVFAEMLSRLPEEDVKELGKLTAEGVAKSAILGRYGEITAETIVDTLRIMAQRGGYGAFDEMLDDGRTVTFRHELGYGGSLFVATVAETVFHMAGIKPETEKTEEAVVMQF